MRSERIAASGDPGAVVAELRALIPAAESVREAVQEIIAAVREEGDAAVLRLTQQLDTGGAPPKRLRVQGSELAAAEQALDPAVRDGLEQAIDNLGEVAELSGGQYSADAAFAGHRVSVATRPVGRAAVYVPGGRAPYPSTVVMGVVPARVAGVGEIAVCSPPAGDGELGEAVLGACGLLGASPVYRMGGAQAIAALAYGTETVTPVDVIVGPGNLYVQEAKRQVFGQVGIDGFAGPSDLIVIADRGEDPELIVLDLLAQAEHGPGTLVVAISDSTELLDALEARLQDAPETGATAALVETADAGAALAIAEEFAPEHLELMGPGAEALADDVTRAGCVFVGARSGTAFGDYIAGSNHILPTGGTARFASGLLPQQFLRAITEVRIEDPDQLARDGAVLARAEGFELHARSMEARIRDNQVR